MKRREIMMQMMGREPDQTLRLPYLPPRTLNESYQGSNIHALAAKRRKIKEQCVNDTTALLHESGWRKGTPPMTGAELLVTFILPDRRTHDHDNLIAGMKPIFDALHPDRKEGRLDGLLVDDGLAVIGIPLYDYEIRPGVRETVIEVWDTTPERLM